MQRNRVAHSSNQSRPVKPRLRHAVPRSRLNDFGDSLLVGVFREQDERNRDASMQEFRHKADRFHVSRIMLKQNQAVWPLAHQLFGLLQRLRMLEFGGEQTAGPFEDLPN